MARPFFNDSLRPVVMQTNKRISWESMKVHLTNLRKLTANYMFVSRFSLVVVHFRHELGLHYMTGDLLSL